MVELDDPDSSYFDWRPGPGGHLAITEYTDHTGEGYLRFFDAAGRSLGSLRRAPSSFGSPAWLPGGEALVMPTGSGLDLVRLTGGEPVVEPLELASVHPEFVYVLSR
jgi:hypothetical protein